MGFKPHTKNIAVALGHAVRRQEQLRNAGYSSELPSEAAMQKLKIVDGWKFRSDDDGSYASTIAAIASGDFDEMINSWSPVKNRATILYLAIDSGSLRLVETVLSHGADPERTYVAKSPRIKLGEEPPLVSSSRKPAMLRLLLQYGAKVDAVLPGTDRTALFMATRKNNREAIEILLEAGADPLYQSSFFVSPLAKAKSFLAHREPEVVALLEAARVNQDLATSAVLEFDSPQRGKVGRGVKKFAFEWLEHEHSWGVALVKAGLKETSESLRRRYRGAEVLVSPKSVIPDKARAIFCLKIRDCPWVVVYETVGVRQYFDDWHTKTSKHASKYLNCETIAFGTWEASFINEGKLIEEHGRDWDPESIVEDEMNGDISSRGLDRLESKQLATMSNWFAERDVYVPPLGYRGNGHSLGFTLSGIRESDIEGFSVILVR